MPAFTPTGSVERKQQAFTTLVTAPAQVYTFLNSIRGVDATGSSNGIAFQTLEFSSALGQLSSVRYTEYTYDRGIVRRLGRICKSPCAGLTQGSTASGEGISFTLANARFETDPFNTVVDNPPTTPVVLNGTLSGEIAGGYLFTRQLPRATSGMFSVDNAVQTPLFSTLDYPVVSTGDPTQFPNATVQVNANKLTVSIQANPAGSGAPLVQALWGNNQDGFYSAVVTSAALQTQPGGYLLKLDGQALTNSATPAKTVVVTAAVQVGRPGGVLSTAGEADFAPLNSIVAGSNADLNYDFRAAIPANSSVQPAVLVTMRGGVVQTFLATSASGKLYSCDSVGSLFTAKCGGSLTLSADGRSLIFNGFTAARTNTTSPSVTFNGTLTAAGL